MLVSGQVQEYSAFVSQASYTCPALPAGVTAGNLVYVSVQYGSALARTFQCSMNGVQLTEIGTGFHNATDQWGIRHFYYPNTPAIAQANTSVIVNNFSNNPIACGISVQERSGLLTASPVDGTQYLAGRVAAPGTGTDAINFGGLTNSSQPAELVGVIANVTGAGGPPDAGTGFTSLGVGWDYSEGVGTNSMRVVDRELTTVGSTNVTATALPADASAAFYGSAVIFLRASAAASLTSPTPSGTLGTTSTATVGASTNQQSGTLYAVVDSVANLAGVTASQIIAGQRASGAAALAAGNAAISTGSPSVAITGLSPSTTYGYALVQVNGNGNSNIATGTFTTASTVVPVITDAGDEIYLAGEAGILIAGSGFLTPQGGGQVYLSPTNNVNDPNRVAQTVTSWNATQIQFTAVRGSLAYLTTLYLFVVNSASQSNVQGYAVQLEPRVYIRDAFVNLQSNPRANETGLRVLVWRSLPTFAAPNPSQVLENQTLDGSGNSNWEIARGSLAVNDPIWFAVVKDGATPIGTMRKFTPTYE